MEGTGPDSSASRALRDLMFFMALRLDSLSGQIIHRDPVLSLDSIISDLVVEETRLHSLSVLSSASTSKMRLYLQLHLGLLLQETLIAAAPPPDSIVPSVRGRVILAVFDATPDLAITARRQVKLSANVSVIQGY